MYAIFYGEIFMMAKKSNTDDRKNQLKDICEKINKSNWGGANKDALNFLGNKETKLLERWPSGSPELDDALGGGWPMGRIIELYGAESSGKSTLTLHAIAEFQRSFPDDNVALIDTEFAFDTTYAKNLGVNTDLLLINQPESGEQALNVLDQMLDLGVKLFVVDSVAALTPQAELNGEIGDAHIGLQARMMSQALRRLVSKLGKSNATIIFTNQTRDKINTFGFGDKSTTSGGKALKFYSSVRVEVARIGSEKQGDVIVSNKVKATVKKNKTFSPFRIANFIITFGYGIDQVAAVLDDAINKKIVDKSGAWFSYGETRLGQGRQNTLDFLRTNEGLLDEIKEKCKTGKVEIEKDEKQELPEVFSDDEDDNTEVEEV